VGMFGSSCILLGTIMTSVHGFVSHGTLGIRRRPFYYMGSDDNMSGEGSYANGDQQGDEGDSFDDFISIMQDTQQQRPTGRTTTTNNKDNSVTKPQQQKTNNGDRRKRDSSQRDSKRTTGTAPRAGAILRQRPSGPRAGRERQREPVVEPFVPRDEYLKRPYTKDPDDKTEFSEIAVQQIRQLISERATAKLKRHYDVVDRMEVLLQKSFGVRLWDKERLWTTRQYVPKRKWGEQGRLRPNNPMPEPPVLLPKERRERRPIPNKPEKPDFVAPDRDPRDVSVIMTAYNLATVERLLEERFDAKWVRNFEKADVIEDQLMELHNVKLWDRYQMWTTLDTPPICRPNSTKGPKGHDYDHVGTHIDPNVCQLTEPQIDAHLAKWLQLLLECRDKEAEYVKLTLYQAGVSVSDKYRKWRADGNRVIGKASRRLNPNRPPPNRPITMDETTPSSALPVPQHVANGEDKELSQDNPQEPPILKNGNQSGWRMGSVATPLNPKLASQIQVMVDRRAEETKKGCLDRAAVIEYALEKKYKVAFDDEKMEWRIE